MTEIESISHKLEAVAVRLAEIDAEIRAWGQAWNGGADSPTWWEDLPKHARDSSRQLWLRREDVTREISELGARLGKAVAA
jgi:hypothetical protein